MPSTRSISSVPNGYYGHPNPTRGECDYLEPDERDALADFTASTNGLAEDANGDLIAVSLGGEVYRFAMSDDGDRILRTNVIARLIQPLDVTVQGPRDAFPGTIWAAQYSPSAPEDRSPCSSRGARSPGAGASSRRRGSPARR